MLLTEYLIIEILFASAAIFTGMGLMVSKKEIKEAVNNIYSKLEDHIPNIEYNEDVHTAEATPEIGTVSLNLRDMSYEMKDTMDSFSGALEGISGILEKYGLDDAKNIYDNVKRSYVYSTLTHEMGHLKEGASEVKAELYRKSHDMTKITSDDVLDYSISLYNLVKNGGKQGYETAQKTYDALKSTYGDAAKDIGTITNNMLEKSYRHNTD